MKMVKKIMMMLLALAMGASVTHAAMVVALGNGDDTQMSTTFTFSNLEATSAFNGGALNSVATLGENTISGASGSFTVTWTAIGASNINDAATWTFGDSVPIKTINVGWAVAGNLLRLEADEAILLTFNTNNLTLDAGKSLVFSLKGEDADSWNVYKRTGTSAASLETTTSAESPAIYSEDVTVDGLEYAITVNDNTSFGSFRVDIVGDSTGVTVPDVVDLSQSAAQTAIEGAGLVLGTVTDAYSATIAISNVVSQSPVAGANVASNTAVNLALSIGPDPTPSMIQHLIAADTNVVGNPVTEWIDRSGSGNNAGAGQGSVTYPSASVSGSGLHGLDFGATGNSLELFSAADSDAWLEFSGAAAANSGFCVLMSFRVDDWNTDNMDLIGNSTLINQGFCMRLGTDGTLKAWVEGTAGAKTAPGKAVLRDTMVVALNYNASTGNVEFWDSTSKSASSWTAAAIDNSMGTPVTVGMTTGASRFFIGMVGEVKIFDRVLDSTELNAETAAMVDDWVTVTSIKTPEQLTAVSDIGLVELDWLDDISGDLFASYSVYRSTESGTNYVEIASNLTDSAYTDTTGDGAVPYYYVVTAIDTNDVESAYSNEAEGTLQVLSVLQHLDATIASSVVVAGNVVTQWQDQSASSNDAVAAIGSVVYPSTLTSSAGLSGLDFAGGLHTLELFSAPSSDSWLDQSGAGDGFCVMLSVVCDELVPGVDNELIGNSSDGSTGFRMLYTATGEIQAELGGLQLVSTGRSIAAGETLIVVLNYDPDTGTCELWDSKNYTVVSNSLTKADFSTANAVTLGRASPGGNYFNGVVGEVVIYGESLRAAHFESLRNQLMNKWVKRPNIVMFFMDDWAWYGSSVIMDERMANSHIPDLIEMPNLDLMAESGMVFRNAYGSPQCSPARAALMTGQSNPRNGFTVYMNGDGDDYYEVNSDVPGDNYYGFPVMPNGSDATLRADATSIAEALAPMGYKSALFGKWHLRDDPNNEGFYAPDGDTDNGPGNNAGDTLDGIVDPKLMTHITDSGIAFMEEQVAAGKPFYVQFSHYAMHEGRECFPATRMRYQNEPAIVAYNGGETDPANLNHKNDPAVWLGMAYELDQKLGEVRQKLVDLGIADNTYVVMVGDNGYRHEFFSDVFGLTQPQHAHKWWAWQAGIRVPMVVEGPGVVSNSRTTANVVNYDFLPTFVDWAGGNPTALPDLDGVSLKGLMAGEPQSEAFLNRSLYFHYPHYRTTMPHSVVVKGSDKIVYFYETPVRFPSWDPIMLFDLNNDVGEYHNIYMNNPALGDALYADMTNYLDAVGARIPLVPHPNYDQAIYDGTATNYFEANFVDPADAMKSNAKDYAYRVLRGPFIGTRAPEEDETGPVTFMEYWMNSFGVDLGAETDDYDGDGVVNWAEYAAGSDPTDPASVGTDPVFELGVGTWTYKYEKRNDDSSLSYTVESTTNLITGGWAPVASNKDVIPTAGYLEEVTETAPMTNQQSFIRLKVER
ncbi:sulfatase-like hydrolase/transferase [Pontiella sulfatireligans]|uniref:Amylopullulanase n=1 Tax=Pontiella sulfatireligans TaxID=2750658 RepID=A0A6C2UT67_9BACT|nr:sulfatase-like hydrolase/transferase [Pontiella sulfatireligans]SPS74583.1 sulfatase S1_16 [Kiritimatiellales bacterium]VGO23532.1 Amylopullulanase [Pontiella sulfatireligans]